MTVLRARYRTGSWVSISAPRRWLLVDLEPQHRLVHRLWEATSGGDGAEDVLDILFESGVRAVPSFMLLWMEETPLGFLRGPGVLEVATAGSTTAHSGERHLVCAEVAVDPDASEFILRSPATGAGPELPMASGVTMAAQVVVTTASVHRDAGATPPAEDLPRLPGDEAASAEPLSTEPPAAESPADEPRAEADPADRPDEPAAAGDAMVESPAPSYDHLFGATMRPVAVGAALAGPAERAAGAAVDGTEPGFGITAGWHTSTPLPRPDAVEPAPDRPAAAAPEPPTEPVARAGPPALIDGVPWLSTGSGQVAAAHREPPPLPPPARGGDRSGGAGTSESAEPADAERTVNRAALLAEMASAGSGPTVLAGRCPAGHLTSSHSATCRVCRATVPAQQPFEVARPALGVLRLSTGDRVTLDRGVLIGRKPATPVDAADRPHLVRVTSPEHDVSRQHAEIVLEGWQVYVRDLGSTNGTTVTLPGQPSQRLREGELQLIEHGTVIVLADEIQCVFEVTP